MTDLWAGEFGRYQWKQYLLHLLPALMGGVHMLSQVEVGATPKHRCAVTNDTILDYIGSCHYLSSTNETVACTAWEYDRTYYQSTIVTDWDLVCDKRWMASVAQSCYMLGALTAAFILGQLSDRYGRWKLLVPTGALQMVFAVGCGFVRNYYIYIVLRFLIALNTSGAYMVGFVLTMEMAPERLRTLIGFSFQLVFAVGITVVAGWAYLIRDWPLLQIILGLHSSLMLLHWWLVDESPRWLFSQGRHREAETIIRKMLIENGKADAIPEQGFPLDQLRQALSSSNMEVTTPVQEQETNQTTNQKYGIIDLFRTPRLRSRTINISLNWFANSLVYYGLSLNTGSLVGDPHLMLFISGVIEIPAYLLSARIIDVLGRRPVISFCLIWGGLACICTTYFPQNTLAWTTATICVVMLAKSLISISFAIIYNYTAELFPTVVRSSAVGIGSTFARLSGVLTPLIFLMVLVLNNSFGRQSCVILSNVLVKDSLDPKLPSVLFGVVALLAGFFSLYLAETKDSGLFDTLAEGEEFGRGDTCFARLCGRKMKSKELDKRAVLSSSLSSVQSIDPPVAQLPTGQL